MLPDIKTTAGAGELGERSGFASSAATKIMASSIRAGEAEFDVSLVVDDVTAVEWDEEVGEIERDAHMAMDARRIALLAAVAQSATLRLDTLRLGAF